MIKNISKFAFILTIFFVKTTFAQLPDGSIAPNFIYNDLNAVSRDMYSYLNQGKTVYLDVSAAWCGPCWNYHSGAIYGGENILKYIKLTSSTAAGVTSYTSLPSVSIVGGGGSGAVAEAVLTNGVVTKINITNHGIDYTSPPTIIIGTPWLTSSSFAAGDQVFAGNYLYTVTAAGTTSSVAPNHNAAYTGTLWTSVTSLTTGTQIYYGNNLYVVSIDGVTGTDPVTHTSGSVTDGSAVLDFIGQTGPERNNGTALLKYVGIAAKANVPAAGVGKEAALHELWRKHGLVGQPGVEAGSTNDVVVFFLEAETTNTLAQLNGINAGSTHATNTKGDWVNGTSYPIINLPNNVFNANYNINYFPTLYMICPNRTITEVGQLSYDDLEYAKGNCPAPASQPNDAALLSINRNVSETCDNAPLIVTLQNNGTSPLTTCAISVSASGTLIATYSWSGNLALYATKILTLTTVSPIVNTDYDVLITSTDADAANNSQTFTINRTTIVNKKNIKIEIATDRYGSETTWKLFNGAGAIVTQGGPYTNGASNITYPQPSYEEDLTDDCYKFVIYDSDGDGMDSGYGVGYYKVYSNDVLVFEGGNFSGGVEQKNFELIHEDDVTGISELILENGLLVYPNPISRTANVTFELKKETNVKISIQNMLGQTVYSSDLGNLDRGVNSHSIDASTINNGLYLVTVNMGSDIITKKITINK